MSNLLSTLFPTKTRGHYIADISRTALQSTTQGIFGGLLLAQMSNVAFSTAALASYAGACALGGVILIVPFMMAYKFASILITPHLSPNFILDFFASKAIKMVFAVATAALGAALVGLTMMTVIKAALIGALAFALLDACHTAIHKMTPNTIRANESSTSDAYIARYAV